MKSHVNLDQVKPRTILFFLCLSHLFFPSISYCFLFGFNVLSSSIASFHPSFNLSSLQTLIFFCGHPESSIVPFCSLHHILERNSLVKVSLILLLQFIQKIKIKVSDVNVVSYNYNQFEKINNFLIFFSLRQYGDIFFLLFF